MTGMTWGPGAVGPGAGDASHRSGPRAEDVLLAIACALLGLVSLTGRISPLGESDEDWLLHFRGADGLGIALVLAGSAGVLLIRTRPLVAVVVVDSCMFALHAVGFVPPPLPAAELVVLYAIASTLRPLVSTTATAVTALVIVVGDLVHDISLDDDKLVAYLLAVVMAWMVGYVMQVRARQARTADENARLLAEQASVRTQMAVREEKERLTRELHDIVAHGVGVMVALASTARVGGRSGPADPDQALTAIESTGRAALQEMRTLMRDLRGDAEEAEPMLSASSLGTLVDRTRAAGIAVDLDVEGEPRPLPAGVDQAAFRVVQESITNVLRHSGAGHVQVSIGYQPDAIDIRVRDDGVAQLPRRRAEDRAAGQGHEGMRRRVDLLGGVFAARHTPAGFEVVATIPLGPEP